LNIYYTCIKEDVKILLNGLKMLIKEKTWEEAEELFKKGIAIILIGSIEQHGPHLPLGSDSYYAFEIAKRIGEYFNIAVLPIVEYSVTGYNMAYPSITIEPETLTEYLKDICKSLKFHGVNKVIFIAGHGGENVPAIRTASYIIARDLGIKILVIFPWQFLPKAEAKKLEKDWHAGYLETSDMLYLKPELVKKNKIKKSSVPKPMNWISPYYECKRDWRKGVLGNPIKASAKVGRKNFEAIVKNLINYLKPLIKD